METTNYRHSFFLLLSKFGATCRHCYSIIFSPESRSADCPFCLASVREQEVQWSAVHQDRLVWNESGNSFDYGSLNMNLLPVPLEYLCLHLNNHLFVSYLRSVRQSMLQSIMRWTMTRWTAVRNETRHFFAFSAIKEFCDQIAQLDTLNAEDRLALHQWQDLLEHVFLGNEVVVQNIQFDFQQQQVEQQVQEQQQQVQEQKQQENEVSVLQMNMESENGERVQVSFYYEERESRAVAYFNVLMDLLESEERKTQTGDEEDVELRLAMCCTPCTLQEVDENTLKTVNHRCNVCFEEFTPKLDHESVVFLLIINACQHVFHHECVAQWLCTKRTCPLCRVKL
jgi:hypothetical protein